MAKNNQPTFVFDATSRIGADDCAKTEDNVQNSRATSYLLSSLGRTCNMDEAVKLATSQPAINYSGTHQVGEGGCNIDQNSELLLSAPYRAACIVSLQQRPYATVPYLGKGAGDAEMEARLQQGECIVKHKSTSTMSEVSLFDRHATPMIPSVAADMANPANFVESSADDRWVRGGIPARDLDRA